MMNDVEVTEPSQATAHLCTVARDRTLQNQKRSDCTQLTITALPQKSEISPLIHTGLQPGD